MRWRRRLADLAERLYYGLNPHRNAFWDTVEPKYRKLEPLDLTRSGILVSTADVPEERSPDDPDAAKPEGASVAHGRRAAPGSGGRGRVRRPW